MHLAYKSLNIEPLRGHDGVDIFLAESLQNRGLACIVQTKHKNACLFFAFFQAAQQVE